MSTFIWHPTNSADLTQEPKVQSAKFGDGYEQRSAFGLNTNPQIWALSFVFDNEDEYRQCRDFLKACNGVLAFDWTPPGETSALRFACKKWTPKVESGPVWTMSATFEQDFGN